MNTRIKKIRKMLDLTQREFGERIGVKGNTIAQYELGRNNPVDSVLSLICREFNVNEEWLRTGKGEMFNPSPVSVLDSLAEKYGLSHDERVLVERFINLKPDQRRAVIDFVRKTASAFSGHGTDPSGRTVPAFDSLSIEEKVQLYRLELEREEKVAEESEA